MLQLSKLPSKLFKETGVKEKSFMPIRVAVSGQMHGPELPETIELLGRENH